MSMIRYVTGLDLGQSADFTALAVVAQSAGHDDRRRPVVQHAVVHLHRFELGTPYPAIVEGVRALFSATRDMFTAPPLAGSRLVIDRTGVGAAVFDMFKQSGIRAEVSGWSITAGRQVTDDGVPKADLVAAVQATLGQRRLRIAPELPLADTLAKELETFRVKVTPDRNETFAAWRERDHDDLVLALALAAWLGEKLGPPVPVPPPMILGGEYVVRRP